MGSVTAMLAGLRVLAMIVALGAVGLGAWSIVIIHDIDMRGKSVLDNIILDPQDKKDAWQSFLEVALTSTVNVCIAIAGGAFTALTTTLLLLHRPLSLIRLPTLLLLPLDVLCTLSISASFGATLSLALKTTNFILSSNATEPSHSITMIILDTSTSSDLRSFSALLPISKAYAISCGGGVFLLVCSSIAAVIMACQKRGDSNSVSFEPTANALGMSRGYQAEVPRTSRGNIPTMYDMFKPFPRQEAVGDEERGFAMAGAAMGRTDSVAPRVDRRLDRRNIKRSKSEREISKPLELKNPEAVAQIRPAHRPWSELPKKGHVKE